MATEANITKTNTMSNDPMITVIERVALDPNSDVSKLEKMLAMQERIMAKNAEIAFNQAMARLQPELPVIEKISESHNSKYAKYEDIDIQVRPLYTKEGFSVSFTSKRDGDLVTYYGTLKHVDGHSTTAEIDLPDDKSGSKNPIQAKASTITYAKRYLLAMLLNIVTKDEDTDGNGYSQLPVTEEQLQTMQRLIEQKGSSAKAICEKFGVKSLKDLPQKKYIAVYNILNARKDAQHA